MDVDVTDPFANSAELQDEYGYKLVDKVRDDYDAVIVAVSHEPYHELSEEYFKGIMGENGILVDEPDGLV